MKRLSIFLIISLLFLRMLEAQESFVLEGSIVSSVTQEALIYVNIFDQQSSNGAFSNIDGQFEIKISKLPTTLIFSAIGYKNLLVKLEQKPDAPLQIALQKSILRLPDIEVIAEPKVEKLTPPTFTIKDFLIENDKILLVKYGGIAVGDFLELCDLDGHVLHSLPIKTKGIIEYMHQSCLGNIHLVGSNEAIEVDITSNEIILRSKYPRYQFDRLLKPCVDASDDYVYFKYERALGQSIKFDFISKKDRAVSNSVVVNDVENMSRIPEELGLYNMSESYYSAALSYPNNPHLTRPEVFDAWIGIFYKPLFSPLYNTGEEVCLFNHTLGFLRFYTFDGKLKRQLPVNYHKEKKWDKKILKDKKTGKFYTVYGNMGSKKFYEINLNTGTVTPAFKMNCDFVEKMIIYGDHLYYQDSGIIPGKANRILHKVKVK